MTRVAPAEKALARGRTAFEHAETIFRFAAIAGLTATVNASLAAIAPAPLGIFDWPAFSYLWTNWWFATVTGSLAVAPFAILWLTTLGSKILWREFGESLLVLSLLTLAALIMLDRLTFLLWLLLASGEWLLCFVLLAILDWRETPSAVQWRLTEGYLALMRREQTARLMTMYGVDPKELDA